MIFVLLLGGGSAARASGSLSLDENRKLCDRSTGIACFGVAEYYRQHQKEQFQLGKLLYDRSCRSSYSPGCRSYLQMREKSSVQTKTEALSYFREECARDITIGCHYALLITAGMPKTKLTTKALLQGLKENCLKGFAPSCTEAGVKHFAMGEKNEAETWLTKGCLQGDAFACGYEGTRPALLRDPKVALDVYTTGCEIYDGFSCVQAGKMYEARYRYVDAQTYYHRACKMKVVEGSPCVAVASAMVNDARVKDAEELLGESCGWGDASACSFLGRLMFLQLKPGHEMYLKAAQLFSDQCDHGDKAACERAAESGELANRGLISYLFPAWRFSLAIKFSQWFR